MHRTISVTVKKKIATAPDTAAYICGNGDFTINFNFDTEWDAYNSKTARFIMDYKTFIDVVFQGTSCTIPIITDSVFIYVGVYAGNLCTTTPAAIWAKQRRNEKYVVILSEIKILNGYYFVDMQRGRCKI